MGGRSGQRVNQGAASRAAASALAAYPNLTINYTGLFPLPKGYTQKDALELAGIPKDATGSIDIKTGGDKSIYVEYSNEGLKMNRIINTNDKEVKNDYFKIEDNSRYRGRGYKIFEAQVNALRKKGFKQINVYAAGSKGSVYNGYYTWAVFGYVPKYPSANLQAINFNAGTNYSDWFDVIRTRTGAALWKEYGREWEGTFDLSDNSESMKTWRGYLKYKKSQNR